MGTLVLQAGLGDFVRVVGTLPPGVGVEGFLDRATQLAHSYNDTARDFNGRVAAALESGGYNRRLAEVAGSEMEQEYISEPIAFGSLDAMFAAGETSKSVLGKDARARNEERRLSWQTFRDRVMKRVLSRFAPARQAILDEHAWAASFAEHSLYELGYVSVPMHVVEVQQVKLP